MHNFLHAGSEWCSAVVFSLRVQSKSCFLIGLCGVWHREEILQPSGVIEWLFTMHLSFSRLCILVTCTSRTSPNWTVLKTPLSLSAAHLFLLRVYFRDYFLSFCAWVCVCISLCVWLSVQFLWYHTSFRNWLSYDNSEGIIQYYCSRCFDVWIEACRADRYDSEDETWTGVAPTKNAATENLNNRHTYGDGQDAFHCILKRDRCL